LAAVDKAEAATLPLSFIPSKNDPSMTALHPIMSSRHTIRTPTTATAQTVSFDDDDDDDARYCSQNVSE